MNTLDRITGELRDYVADLEPGCYSGVDAARLTAVATELTNLGETTRRLFAKRAADTGAWTRTSHAVSAEQWLAVVSGTSEHAARETLVVADRVDALPSTAKRLRAGELSLAQAAHVTAAAAIAPASEMHMLHVAEHRGFRELRTEKERVIALAIDETKARESAHRERHLRSWTRAFATDCSISGPTDVVNEILDAVEPLARERFEAARAATEHESHDAYRFDALLELVRRARTGTETAPTAPPVGRVHVGLQSLLAGRTMPGEVCEIPGVGPVPVAHAREVLSHGLLELAISDGVDVQTVVSTTRHVPRALKIAIDARDGGRCKIRDCDHTRAIQRHHTLGYAEHHTTSYQVLGGICPDHHHLITHQGYQVIDNNDGTWALRAPPHTNAA